MKIFQIVPINPQGEVPVFMALQHQALREAGHELTLFGFRGDQLFRQPVSLIKTLWQLRQALLTAKPDVVHAQLGSLLGFCAALVCPANLPFIVQFRGSDINPTPSEAKWKQWVRLHMSRFAANRADHVIAVSQALTKWLPKRLTAPVTILPSGTNTNIFKPMDRQACREKLGWPPARPVVFFYEGRSPEVKRRDLADKVYAKLQKDMPDLDLFICTGDFSQAELAVYLNSCDVALMLSDYEGSPNIVREAIACHVPVVSVPVGDVAAWITGAKEGQIIERDVVAIAAAAADYIGKDRPVPTEASAPLPFGLPAVTSLLIALYAELCHIS